MATFGCWRSGYFQINGVDLSDHVREIGTDLQLAELPANVHGDNTAKVFAGLEIWQIAATFLQDFSADKVDATLSPLRQVATSPFWFVIGAERTDPSSTAPWYKGLCILTKYTPFHGPHGSNMETIATFQVVSTLRRVTDINDDQRIRPLDSSLRVRPVPHSTRKRPQIYTGWP